MPIWFLSDTPISVRASKPPKVENQTQANPAPISDNNRQCHRFQHRKVASDNTQHRARPDLRANQAPNQKSQMKSSRRPFAARNWSCCLCWVNMGSRNPPVHTTSQKAGSSPKPKNQRKTQPERVESLNLFLRQSRNKKIR